LAVCNERWLRQLDRYTFCWVFREQEGPSMVMDELRGGEEGSLDAEDIVLLCVEAFARGARLWRCKNALFSHQ
jgi:hypothetical protein